MGALACRQDVLAEIWPVDRVPDGLGRPLGGLVGEGGVPVEVRFRFLEGGGAKEKKPLNIPALDVGLGRVDVRTRSASTYRLRRRASGR